MSKASVIENNALRILPNANSNGSGQIAFNCPVHSDEQASGSFLVGEDGRPLLTCHAGCSNAEIANALGFAGDGELYSALDGRSNGKRRTPKTIRKIVSRRSDRKAAKKIKPIPDATLLKHLAGEFIFRGKNGKRLYKEVRYEWQGQKTIRMFTYEDGAWVPHLRKDVPRVPYRLDELQGRTSAWWVEGPAVVAALHAIGIFATTSIGGANSWRKEHAAQLKDSGIKRLYFQPDNDDPGRAYTKNAARDCHAAGIKVKIVTLPGLPEKGDAVEWIAAGGTKAALLTLKKQTPWYAPPKEQADYCSLEGVTPEQVEYLWSPYLPLGTVTCLDGDPGDGKSHASLSMAANLSRGEIPGRLKITRVTQEGKPVGIGKTLIVSTEDGMATTVVPRLILLGADLQHTYYWTQPLTLDEDGFQRLDHALQRIRPVLVIIDPLVSFLGAKVDMFRSNQTRPVLDSLGRLATTYRCAILCIRHLTKGKRDHALYRGQGSIDFSAQARSVLITGRNPKDPEERVMVQVKATNAKLGPSLTYTITDAGFRWTGTSALTAEDLWTASRNAHALPKAEKFLRDVLKDRPMHSTALYAKAEAAGISQRSLERVKELGMVDGLTAKRVGAKGKRGGGGWTWALPLARADGGLNGATAKRTKKTGPQSPRIKTAVKKGVGGLNRRAKSIKNPNKKTALLRS